MGLFVFDGVEELDAVGPWKVLANWTREHPEDGWDVFVMSIDGAPVVGAKSLMIGAHHSTASAPPLDVFIHPGGLGTRPMLRDEGHLRWICGLRGHVPLMASVCTGSLVYAAAGLLIDDGDLITKRGRQRRHRHGPAPRRTSRRHRPGARSQAGHPARPRAARLTRSGTAAAAATAWHSRKRQAAAIVHTTTPERRALMTPHTDLTRADQVEPVTIEHQTFGNPSDPAVLLVMGFGAQLLGWDADFCRLLAARGRYVIRYDNRDCGLSTKLDEHPVHLGEFITAMTTGDVGRALAMAPYTLSDMARDGIDLLMTLGIDKAHVVGSSMGGMIAQKMAIEFPDRVLSLTSMMSSTGEQEYGQSTPEAQQVLFSGRPGEREAYVAAAERELVWASRRYGDRAQLRELAAASYDRSYYPAGVPRQLAAMILDGSRAEALKTLSVPTLVIHGLDDTLIDPSGGRRTAELVPGARLVLVEDMGHDRPPALWPRLVEAIVKHTGTG